MPKRLSSRLPARRRSFSTSACASIRRRAHSARAERLYSQRATRRSRTDLRPLPIAGSPDRRGLLGLAGREPGEARAPGPRAPRVTRSCSSTSGSPSSGRVASAEARRRGGRQPRPSPTPPRPNGRTTVLHPNFPPGQPFFVPSFAPPAGLGRPRRRLPSSRALARDARRPDVHAKLLYGLALQRLGHRLSARRAVRRGREARAAGPRGARRRGGRSLRQEPAGGGLLSSRAAHAALPEGADRALPPRAAAPLAGRVAARLRRRGQAPASARPGRGPRLSTCEGSKAAPGPSSERAEEIIDTRTYCTARWVLRPIDEH